MEKEEIIESIEKIKDISEKLLKAKEEIKDEELEKYFYKLEKTRMYVVRIYGRQGNGVYRL